MEAKGQTEASPYTDLISFLGTAIILGTFIVKDVLREEQKDRRDSYEQALTAWQLQEGIKSIENVIILRPTPFESEKNNDPNVQGAKILKAMLEGSLEIVRTGLLDNSMLIEKLPAKQRKLYQAQDKEFSNRLTSLDNDFDEVRDDLSLALLGTSQEGGEGIANARNKLDHILEDCFNLSLSVIAEESRIVEDFKKELSHTTDLLLLWTGMSYVLYPAGVLIGVLGGLAGIKVPGAGE